MNGPGYDCESSEQCENYACVQGKCVTPVRACEGPEECGVDMTCANAEDGSSMCTPEAIDGDPCPAWGCAQDHYCRDDGGDGGVCRPDGELGDDCELPVDLGDENTSCAEGLHCMASSTGTRLPAGALDEPCDTRDPDSCEEGLACAAAMGSTCQPPSALGAPCNPAFYVAACAEGYCACTDEAQADGDLPCIEGQCRALRELGDACTAHTDCASGFCEIYLDQPVCGIPLGERDACVPPAE